MSVSSTASHIRSLPAWLAASRPDTDSFLAQKYSAKTIKDRKLNRSALFAELGLKEDRKPILFIPLSLTGVAGHKMLMELLPAFAIHKAHVLILGGKFAAVPKNVHTVPESERLFHLALGGADMLILPAASDPALLPQLLAWRYGLIPMVSRESSLNGEADDYDPVTESGRSFLFSEGNVWSMHAALVRALETFCLPYDWRGIQRNGLELGN